jgi:hypothetical protein
MRLGDLDAVKKRMGEFWFGDPAVELFVDDIVDGTPTVDAVEVVRCAECKLRNQFGCPMYYEEYLEWEEDGYPESDILRHDHTFDDGFCDRGERKDGEG